MLHIKTLGELKKSGYTPRSIKEELRQNLIQKIQSDETVFKGIQGFDDTVIPDLERAILSKHNVLLLGLRGQAKTRMARLMIDLLDEFIPVVVGSDLNDDPLQPLSSFAKQLIEEKGDDTPITWLHRNQRYVEKLATPDVSVADLIGDVDPIKAATLKLNYGDERVIHFGLIPRAHRCIFVINELPDLQARIQVALFNILQEGDIQIRGFKLRLNLDLQFVFTANPEDYTNRGSIITPLKDRIESQILTHYPTSIDIAKGITVQEAAIDETQNQAILMPEVVHNILERIAFEARESEFIDEKSGVSARLSISGYENLYSTAERRMLQNKEKNTTIRISDFWGVIPAITGKVELVYEGEQEGAYNVALHLLDQAIKKEFLSYFPNPDRLKKGEERDPYGVIRAWFSAGKELELLLNAPNKEYNNQMNEVAGIKKMVAAIKVPKEEKEVFGELLLFGLSSFNVITKEMLDARISFSDMLANMLDDLDLD